MNGLALAAALVFAQGSAAEPAPAPAPEPAARESAAEPTPAPVQRVETLAPSVVTTTVRRRRSPGSSTTTSTTTSTSTTSTSTPTSTSTSTSTSTPTSTSTSNSTRGREELERAARQFLEALVRGDAGALAAAAADRFSFDGDVQAGRESIRRTWRDLLLARPAAAAPALGAVELVEAEDAAARFGKAPARLAPLVRKGVTVAIADVGGRTVVLFLSREGGRVAVLGMHD